MDRAAAVPLELDRSCIDGVIVEAAALAPPTPLPLRQWRVRGLAVGAVGAEEQGAWLQRAGVEEEVDAWADAADHERYGLRLPPAPDLFRECLRRLEVKPSRAAALVATTAGVLAAREAGIRWVMARAGAEQELLKAGADGVIDDFSQEPEEGEVQSPLPSALDHIEAVAGRRPALFLDFDGTLAEIARRPTLAVLREPVRDLLRELCRCGVPVAVVSGRDLEDLRARVGLPEVAYAGSHGFDLLGPPPALERHEPGLMLLPALDAAEQALRARLETLPGIFMERKRYAFAVHYREMEPEWVPTVAEAVREAVVHHAGVQLREGKKVFELVPDRPWGKGDAVLWLMEKMNVEGTPIYVGDDITDEDAFVALRGRGSGVVVQETPAPSAAGYRLANPAEVERFLRRVAELSR